MCKNNSLIISVGIVALNEELYLPELLKDLVKQSYDHNNVELLFIDSGSIDNTKQLFFEFKTRYDNEFYSIQIIDNQKRKQASGWNVAVTNFRGDALLRLDAHARVPINFIDMNAYYLNQGECVVGGLRSAKNFENSNWNNTLLLAELSLFGSSIASYRRAAEEKYVNSMFHACYRRVVLDEVGLFNEYLGRTEDNEFHYRICDKGFKLYYNSQITSYQLIRSDLKKMIKQKYGNGFWIGLTLFVCPKCLSLFHFVPFCFVISLLISFFLALYQIVIPLLGICFFYLVFVIINTIVSFKNKSSNYTTLALFLIFPLLHISYGIGTFIGILKFPFWKEKKKAQQFTKKES